MPMLTPRDIDIMEQDVRDIILGWQTRITVLKPLPPEEQPNWNDLMHEYSGEIHYTLYKNVVAERKDVQDRAYSEFDIDAGAGNKDDGKLMFAMSDLYDFIDLNCQIVYKGVRYFITRMKMRIGETLILISEVTGSNEVWATQPYKIIDCENTSGGK